MSDRIDYQTKGLVVSPLKNLPLLNEIKELVHNLFPEKIEIYTQMLPTDYHELVASAQRELNNLNVVPHLMGSESEIFNLVFPDQVSVQSFAYLRATRPLSNSEQEFVGWHRESFYGLPSTLDSAVFWLPIANVEESNSLQYVPGSHLIPEEILITENLGAEHAGGVEQYSAGHAIGLLYNPKRLQHGVDLKTATPLVVSDGHYALFSAQLIHGNAVNRSQCIRFSIDFRAIDSKWISDNQPTFTSSGKPYFVPVDELVRE